MCNSGACYHGILMKTKFLLFLCLVVPVIFAGQLPPSNSAAPQPPLPVIDYNACPFEGCTFGKWVVTRETTLFTTWKERRKTWATLPKAPVVTPITAIHIPPAPD